MMRPYGLRLDGHRYVLNDNGKRDADFAAVARKRARRSAANDIAPYVGPRCEGCERVDEECHCYDNFLDGELRDCPYDCAECWGDLAEQLRGMGRPLTFTLAEVA